MDEELNKLTQAYLHHPEIAATSFLAFIEFQKERLFITDLSWETFLEEIQSATASNLIAYKESIELAKLAVKH